jgi:Protein of unknown function (DUF3263)
MTSVLPRRGSNVMQADVMQPDVIDDDLFIDDDIEVEPEVMPDAPASTIDDVPSLTDRQQHMLVFERQWWRHAGSKEQAIREQFSLSATRYYQMLNQLLDVPAALAFDPLVVGRLRRLRATRSRARTAR